MGFELGHAAWRALVEADDARDAEAKRTKKSRPWAERRAARALIDAADEKARACCLVQAGSSELKPLDFHSFRRQFNTALRRHWVERAAGDGPRRAQEHDDAHGLRAARAARRAGDAERGHAHPRCGSAAGLCFAASLQKREETGAP